MGAHPRAFVQLAELIAGSSDPVEIDGLLDQWNDFKYRASDWDAEQWGFDTTIWMLSERIELARRASPSTSKTRPTRL